MTPSGPRQDHGVITDPAVLADMIEADDHFDPDGYNFSIELHRDEIDLIVRGLRETPPSATSKPKSRGCTSSTHNTTEER
jgi:hypothetical protein